MIPNVTTGATQSNHNSVAGHFARTVLALFVFMLIPTVAAAAPAATTAAPSNVHHRSAALSGHLDPDGDPGITSCSFEWGSTLAYGSTVPCAEGNSFSAAADVTATIGSLAAGSTYHFRLSAETTSSGPIIGTDEIVDTVPYLNTRAIIGTMGPDGTASTSFDESLYVEINQQNRHLFVLDRLASGIYGIDASGPPSYLPLVGFGPFGVPGPPGDQPAIAVDDTALPSSGNIYYVSANPGLEYAVYGYDEDGSPLTGFPVKTATGRACGAAVDSAGHLWLANHGEGPSQSSILEEYSVTGVKLGSVNIGQKSRGACKLAFAGNDDLYVVGQNGPIEKYTAASNYASGSLFAAGQASDLAIDPATDRVYATNFKGNYYPYGTRVEEYSPGGTLLGEFGEGEEPTDPDIRRGVAVDEATHHVYATSPDTLYVFGDPLLKEGATVSTAPATAVTASVATLNGAVDPEGFAITDCHIEWGLSVRYGKGTPCEAVPAAGFGDVPVSVSLEGLPAGTTYHYRVFATTSGDAETWGEDETFTTRFPPSISATAASNITDSSADLGASINPKEAETTYRLEWGTTPDYGSSAPVPDGLIAAGTSPVPVSAHLSGLGSNTTYHWRVVAQSPYGTTATPNAIFTTRGAPLVETTGTPVRGASTAQLSARVDPRGSATSYHFEFGEDGPCDTDACQATPSRAAGSGSEIVLVNERVDGLKPDTAYHYRVVASNGFGGSPSTGGDRIVVTRQSDAPLSHGDFPGPFGSDRAYEQVSLADTAGNPVNQEPGKTFFSKDGTRSIYQVNGGTPISESGSSLGNVIFSERPSGEHPSSGWHSRTFTPPRSALTDNPNPVWTVEGSDDLAEVVGWAENNYNDDLSLWDLPTAGQSARLFSVKPPLQRGPIGVSADGRRKVAAFIGGTVDPAYPGAAQAMNLFDVSSGAPHMVSLLPGDVSACLGDSADDGSNAVIDDLPWISADGARVFFSSIGTADSCSGPKLLYMRDLSAGETVPLVGPPISGPACDAFFLRTTGSSVFFVSRSRLTADDTEPAGCGVQADGDIYRYGITDSALECLTCFLPIDADVELGGTNNAATFLTQRAPVAPDGSRLYFQSKAPLLPGAGGLAAYRLNIGDGDLAYVGRVGSASPTGQPIALADAISPDGSVLIFHAANAELNPLGGTDNGGTRQLYRYDDKDRSLLCISCPPGGGPAATDVPLIETVVLSVDGSTIPFATPNRLLGADQNTPPSGEDPRPGADVYEWRDGRLLLVSDGLTEWPVLEIANVPPEAPRVSGISASGRDIFFTAPTQYTDDALDGYRRLYDARIGGGIDFPARPRPCPLEVCQGTPAGAPEEAAPASSLYSGPGNRSQNRVRCGKGKLRRHGRCIRKRRHKRARRHGRCTRKGHRRAHCRTTRRAGRNRQLRSQRTNRNRRGTR